MICVYVRFFGLCFKMGWVDVWLICYWLLGIVMYFILCVFVVSGYCLESSIYRLRCVCKDESESGLVGFWFFDSLWFGGFNFWLMIMRLLVGYFFLVFLIVLEIGCGVLFGKSVYVECMRL